MDQRGCCPRLGEHEEAGSEDGAQQQSHVERTETAASHRHGECISAKRRAKQQHTHGVEAGPIRLRPPDINRQSAVGEKKCQQTERCVDKEDRPPTEPGDQDATERWTKRSTDRRHGSEQPHGAAGPFLGNRLADKRHREGHHDGGPEALRRPGGDQQPERGRDAA